MFSYGRKGVGNTPPPCTRRPYPNGDRTREWVEAHTVETLQGVLVVLHLCLWGHSHLLVVRVQSHGEHTHDVRQESPLHLRRDSPLCLCLRLLITWTGSVVSRHYEVGGRGCKCFTNLQVPSFVWGRTHFDLVPTSKVLFLSGLDLNEEIGRSVLL